MRFKTTATIEVELDGMRCDACGAEALTIPAGFQRHHADATLPFVSTGCSYPQGWDSVRVRNRDVEACGSCGIVAALKVAFGLVDANDDDEEPN